jgi:hypothetical protein
MSSKSDVVSRPEVSSNVKGSGECLMATEDGGEGLWGGGPFEFTQPLFMRIPRQGSHFEYLWKVTIVVKKGTHLEGI